MSETTRLPSKVPSVQQGLACVNAPGFSGVHSLFPDLSTELQTAFALIVFHRLLAEIQTHSRTEDPWDQWSTARSRAERLQSVRQSIESIWSNFVSEYRSPLDIQTVLWAKFPLVEDAKPSVRVVDMLIQPASSPLISDGLVCSSLSSTWKYGKVLDSSSSWSARYDKLATPRAIHAVDIMTQLAQLFILLHYVLHPPSGPTIYAQGFDCIGFREITLVILAFSTIIRPGHPYAGNAILNLLAFLVAFPAAPFPNDLSFALLLLSAFISILRLHVPSVPSPLLLLSPMHILPLATAIDQGSSRLYSPILFFSPLFLLSSFLLSFSLENTFFAYTNADITIRSATPMESRLAFLILFAIVAMIIIPSSFFIIATSPPSSDPHISPWDRFTPVVSQGSRKIFIKAVVQYASEHPFPAPFNLIQWPAYLLSKEKTVWRVVAAPCAIAVGLIMRYIP